MHIVYTEHHTSHAPERALVEGRPLDSPEVPARAEIILRTLQEARLGGVIAPVDHGIEPIQAVHDAGYLEFLRTANAASAAYFGKPGPVMPWTFPSRHAARKPRGFLGLKGYYAIGWGTPILEGTWSAAYWSAQCALTAASLVGQGTRAVYSLCRPPGHHAASELYGGYCYLNNAAIAARFLQTVLVEPAAASYADQDGQEAKSKARVAILDVDYHHGNGTQIVFYSDPSVLFCSLHAHPDQEYPYYWGGAEERGSGPGQGTNRNWPLPLGTADAVYLDTLQEALATIRDFAPSYLVVSAGFDTASGDPEGGFRLTSQAIAEVGQRIAALSLPTVIVQEGGYRLETLGQHALAFLRPFAGQRFAQLPEEE